jgi:iron complex outermembrane recepter protein
MRKRSIYAIRLLATTAFGFGAFTFAPIAAADDSAVEKVVVTGVRGKPRSATTTPVPVDVITAQDLERSGALGGEPGQALQNLVPSFNLPRQSTSGPADIVRPAQLRGLSPDQTLVLINGKRRHTSSVVQLDAKTGKGTTPVDFNSIPLSAIKRIEVLRDGAGAQYGSDAIAGVVNVILDDAPEGSEVAVSYGTHITHFDPTGKDVTDGGTWVASAESATRLGEGGFLRFGAEFKDRDKTNRAGLDQIPFFEDPANAIVAGQQNFRPGDAAVQDVNLWFNAAAPLGGSEFYTFGTYNHRDGEGAAFFRYPFSSQNVLSVYPRGYLPVTTGENQDLGLAAGFRSSEGLWTWDLSLNYGLNLYDQGVKNSLNPSLGAASPRSFHSAGFENELLTANADFTRELEVGVFAFGAEYRYQSFESTPGDPASYVVGPFAAPPDSLAIGAQAGNGLRPQDARSASRDVYSLYAEWSADLAPDFFVDLAARYENASDFGDSLAGKASARWEFADGFALRGAVSNSFRAPSLVQTGFQFATTNFGSGGALTTVSLLPVDDPVAVALGARPLDAETSLNYSIGFTAVVAPSFTLTVDAFQIDVDDRITLSERIDCTDPVIPVPTQLLCAGANITDVNFFTNAVDTSTQGIDVVAAYKTEAFDGTLGLTAAFAYAETEIRGVNAPAVAGVQVLGVEERNTLVGAAPKSKIILTADWQDDRWSVLGRLTRYGEATRVFNFGGGFEPEQTYGAEWQLDAELGYQIAEGVNVYAGASNLLDEYPDLSNGDIFYFGNLPYDVLSPIGFNGRYVYAGTRIKL